MAQLSRENSTPLLTNYETTWYASNQTLAKKIKADEFGTIKRMIAKNGHQGPKEIGCSPEFLAWLTDPNKNGGGAITDFGCYGANLMTWLQAEKNLLQSPQLLEISNLMSIPTLMMTPL